MAKTGKSSETKVTRIKASDEPRAKKTSVSSPKKTTKPAPAVKPKQVHASVAPARRNPLSAFLGYFKGSWDELRQVRWPDRRTTWGMTGALLAFTAFFVVVILLLDAGFAELFNLLLGK